MVDSFLEFRRNIVSDDVWENDIDETERLMQNHVTSWVIDNMDNGSFSVFMEKVKSKNPEFYKNFMECIDSYEGGR